MTNQIFSNGYALLIGVGADLPITVQDATAIRDILTAPDRGAYPLEQVTLLTQTFATRQEILEAFDQLTQKVNQDPCATVIIYYSGHGGRIESSNEETEYFLIPYGFDWHKRAETAISGLEFTQKIEAIKAQKLIVMLDCCHAGGVSVPKDVKERFAKAPVPPNLLTVLSQGNGRVVIASSREGEYSYTGEPYSVFTTCLMEALQGKAAVNKDGYARILDILIYLFNEVPKRSSGFQHPFVNKILELGDNFPLCYYADGSKFLPTQTPSLEASLSISGLTSDQRERLEERQDTLRMELKLRTKKLNRFRMDVAIEAGSAVKFQLEQQILQEEAAIAYLNTEIDKITTKLQ